MAKLEILSANLAIGTASVFVLVTAGASLAVDRDLAAGVNAGGAWSLRGSLAPTNLPPSVITHQGRAIQHPARKVVARL